MFSVICVEFCHLCEAYMECPHRTTCNFFRCDSAVGKAVQKPKASDIHHPGFCITQTFPLNSSQKCLKIYQIDSGRIIPSITQKNLKWQILGFRFVKHLEVRVEDQSRHQCVTLFPWLQ